MAYVEGLLEEAGRCADFDLLTNSPRFAAWKSARATGTSLALAVITGRKAAARQLRR
jgi:hypothetical protein